MKTRGKVLKNVKCICQNINRKNDMKDISHSKKVIILW